MGQTTMGQTTMGQTTTGQTTMTVQRRPGKDKRDVLTAATRPCSWRRTGRVRCGRRSFCRCSLSRRTGHVDPTTGRTLAAPCSTGSS